MPPRDEEIFSGDEMILEEQQQHAEEEEDEDLPVLRGKRKAKKMKMGEESGLTDAERRKLRREQRELAEALQDGPVDADEDATFVTDIRDKNNDLFVFVAYTREAVLDAENMHAIASKLSKKVDDMIQVHNSVVFLSLFSFLTFLFLHNFSSFSSLNEFIKGSAF